MKQTKISSKVYKRISIQGRIKELESEVWEIYNRDTPFGEVVAMLDLQKQKEYNKLMEVI